MITISPGVVVEIDGVEYVVDDNAATLYNKNAEDVALTRLIDGVVTVFRREEIVRAVQDKGIIDRL